jgi:hypothetical protein
MVRRTTAREKRRVDRQVCANVFVNKGEDVVKGKDILPVAWSRRDRCPLRHSPFHALSQRTQACCLTQETLRKAPHALSVRKFPILELSPSWSRTPLRSAPRLVTELHFARGVISLRGCVWFRKSTRPSASRRSGRLVRAGISICAGCLVLAAAGLQPIIRT